MTFDRMSRPNGPECRFCGCNDTEVIERPPAGELGVDRWFGGFGKARCNFCQRVFNIKEQPAPPESAAPEPPAADDLPGSVPYLTTRCPACNSPNVRKTSSPKAPDGSRYKIRYHRCVECGHRFRSHQRIS